MPQMSPLLWCNLFILFTLILLLVISKVYFLNVKPLKSSYATEMKTKSSEINWMW